MVRNGSDSDCIHIYTKERVLRLSVFERLKSDPEIVPCVEVWVQGVTEMGYGWGTKCPVYHKCPSYAGSLRESQTTMRFD